MLLKQLKKQEKQADLGNFDKARVMINETVEGINQSPSREDELCQTFVKDLKETLDGISSKTEYYAKGQKKMMWKAQEHFTERNAGTGGYETKAKMNMKKKMMEKLEEKFQPTPTVSKISGPLLNKKLIIGNEHTLISEADAKESITLPGTKMRHNWKVFVRETDSNSVIEKVEFGIHASFQPSQIEVTSPPFEIERVGWGFFVVRIKVYYKPEFNKPPSDFEHELNFAASLTSNEFTI